MVRKKNFICNNKHEKLTKSFSLKNTILITKIKGKLNEELKINKKSNKM